MEKNITCKLGFGCMRLPVNRDGKIDCVLAEKMIDYAYENGINYFDTAWPYHDGESEIFIGKALKKYPRESFWLADKMPMSKIEKKEEVQEIFEKQLEKCQVEYFDNYLCHALNKDNWQKVLDFKVLDYLKEQKKLGKIKHLGFSFHDSRDVLKTILDREDWDFVQLQLNYYDVANGDAQQLIDLAAEHNVPIFVMEPIRGGFLARCVPDAITEIENAYGKNTAPALRLCYAFNIKGVKVVLSGMSTMEQVVENVATAKNPIPMDEKAEKVIKDVMDDINSFVTVPCTKCRYCMPCPAGLDIPEIFRIYNDWCLFKNSRRTLGEIDKLEKKPADCVNCKKCMRVCPQRLEIPEIMKKIAAELSEIK